MHSLLLVITALLIDVELWLQKYLLVNFLLLKGSGHSVLCSLKADDGQMRCTLLAKA